MKPETAKHVEKPFAPDAGATETVEALSKSAEAWNGGRQKSVTPMTF